MRPNRLVLVVALIAALLPGSASPAQAAAVPNSWGFVLVDDPTAPVWTTLDTSRQWGSWKASAPELWADGGRIGPGMFQVRFPRIGTGSSGIAHVTAVGDTGNYCSVAGWYATGSDQIVGVQCHAPGGRYTDTPFTLLWTYRVSYANTTAGTYAQLHYRESDNRAVYSHNSIQGVVLAGRSSTGSYGVRLGRVGAAGIFTGNLQVTAVQRQSYPGRCKVATWRFEGTDVLVNVACYDHLGRPAPSDFTLSYHQRRSVTSSTGSPQHFGYYSPYHVSSNYNNITGGAGNTVGVVAPGRYTLRYPHLGIEQTHAQVVAEGTGPNYCNLGGPWSHTGADAELEVVCFDNAGNPVANRMMAAFTSKS